VPSSHGLHLIDNDAKRPLIQAIGDGLRVRGLIPWFWEEGRLPVPAENPSGVSNHSRRLALMAPTGACRCGMFAVDDEPVRANQEGVCQTDLSRQSINSTRLERYPCSAGYVELIEGLYWAATLFGSFWTHKRTTEATRETASSPAKANASALEIL
jgi:hypothetical protein